MPWCESCARFWNPSSVGSDAACPTCGRKLPEPRSPAEPEPGDDSPKAPWHFKLLLVALFIYLGYRAVQGVMWLVSHL